MKASTFQSVQNGLRVIPGDWRVSAGGIRLAQQSAMQSGADAFVQALMERYNGWQTHWSSLDLAFRQRPAGMTMSPIYHQVQMHVAPRLHLTIQGETHILHQRSIERVGRTLREQLVHHLRVKRTLREQLVHYLSARGTRIDAVATQGSLTASGFNNALSPGTRADLPLARPIPRVVRRPVTELAPENPGAPVETPMTLSGRRPAVVSRTSPPAPAPVDVHRLTDQVIQAIDRRIVAQRERLGRI
jgi:hypothetical protein